MLKQLFSILFMLMDAYHRRRDHKTAFLIQQVKMLKRRLGNKTIIPTVEERDQLIALGAKLGHDVADCIEVVTEATYRRWLRKGKERSDVGRKPTAGEAKELVLEMKRLNETWGYLRITAELAKLGIALGKSTVKRILEREFPPPPKPENSPKKRPTVPWSQFLFMHIDSMFGCDFIKKKIYSIRHGILEAFILVVIHHQSRRVYCSPATYHPDKIWLEQQVRNISMWIEDENILPRFMIHDRDGAFLLSGFDEMLKKIGIRGIKCIPAAPNQNAMIESFNANFRRECLDYFHCFSLAQLNRIVSQFRIFYNQHRPHQGKGIGNKVLDKSFVPQATGKVRCKTFLGGLLKHYYRDTA